MIIMVGYGTISCIIAGQILSAVSNGSMTIVVGIVITALISWTVAVFGMHVFHVFERYLSLACRPILRGASLTPTIQIRMGTPNDRSTRPLRRCRQALQCALRLPRLQRRHHRQPPLLLLPATLRSRFLGRRRLRLLRLLPRKHLQEACLPHDPHRPLDFFHLRQYHWCGPRCWYCDEHGVE